MVEAGRHLTCSHHPGGEAAWPPVVTSGCNSCTSLGCARSFTARAGSGLVVSGITDPSRLVWFAHIRATHNGGPAPRTGSASILPVFPAAGGQHVYRRNFPWFFVVTICHVYSDPLRAPSGLRFCCSSLSQLLTALYGTRGSVHADRSVFCMHALLSK